MPVDYHMHTPLCKHAKGEPEEYATQAVACGLKEIGFSDHNPMPPWYDPHFRMTIDQFDEYLGMVERARKAFEGRLTIRLGTEADFFPGTETFVKDLLNRADFDYVIGSVHYIGDWGFDNPEYVEEFSKRDIDEIYTEYYGMMEEMARTGLFDIAGHFDLVKKFGHRPKTDMTPNVRRALEAIRDAGMTMELNTSGWRKPVKELYPSVDVVRLAKEVGVPVTLGSDSHDPADVGADFDRALGILKEVGYREVWKYEKRKRMPVIL